MHVKLALLADYANVTAEGKLNILGIFAYSSSCGADVATIYHPPTHPTADANFAGSLVTRYGTNGTIVPA